MTVGLVLLITASASGLTGPRIIQAGLGRLHGARPQMACAGPQTPAGRATLPCAARSRCSSPRCSAIALARVTLDPKLIAVSVGGTFAGGLHAVTGPDHLAALLPLCIGRRWWTAINTGLYWGLGHGIGAALVGAIAFCIRDALNIDVFSTYMEAAVGVSIMIIGLSGIAEAREWSREHDDGPTTFNANHDIDVILDSSPALGTPAAEGQPVLSTLLTGILHGCTGTGHLLGVMPALAMPSWICATAYLTSFGLGTCLAMSLFTAVVGELSVQMAQRLNQRDMPAKLAMASSVLALVMGTVWTSRACAALSIPQLIGRSALRLSAAVGSRFGPVTG